MASLPLYFDLQFFTNAGAPASLHLLYTYENGTTTPKQTFADAAGLTANANPLTLNSAGRGAIWLAAGSYSFELKDPGGTLVKRFDGISSASDLASAISADLANTSQSTKGAALVGFDSSLAYATGTIGGFIRAVDVSVFNYIPATYQAAILAGTSTVDVTSYIAQAITAAIARAPARVVFPPGKYKTNSVLGQFTGSNITIEGNGSTIDATGVQTTSSDHYLKFAGSYSGSAVSLTANAVAQQKSVSVNSSSFAVGDMVRIYSDSVWDSARTSSKYGEINWVETIPGGASLTLRNDLAASYNTANAAKIGKVTPCENITIKNLTLVGPSPNDLLFAMRHTLCKNLVIENVKSFDWDTIHCQLVDCCNSKVIGCHFEEANSSSTGYGLSFADATQDCIAIANTFTNVRHSLSTNNSPSSSYGIVRRIKFEANVVTDSATTTGGAGGDAIDSHAGAENIEIVNNTVYSASGSGINAEGRSYTITGNQVFNCTGNGITWQNYTDQPGEADISGNRVRGVYGNYGIAVIANVTSIKSLTFNGNNVKSDSRPIQISGASGKTIDKVTAVGNVAVTGVANNAFVAEYCNYLSVTGGSMEALAIGIQLENCNYSNVVGAAVELTATSGATGYGVRLQGTGAGNVVAACTLVHSGALTSATAVSFINTTITYSQIYGCTAKSFTAATVFNKGTGTGNTETNDVSF